jgi:hypothetical protein
MSKSVKVWSVSSGSYSDYRVHCLFTTKKAAKAAIAGEWGYEAPFVEKFFVYEEAPPSYVERRMQCTVGIDGQLVSQWGGTDAEWDDTSRYLGVDSSHLHDLRVDEDYNEAFTVSRATSPAHYRLSVSGNDPEQVAKVYGERKAALMARLAGLT